MNDNIRDYAMVMKRKQRKRTGKIEAKMWKESCTMGTGRWWEIWPEAVIFRFARFWLRPGLSHMANFVKKKDNSNDYNNEYIKSVVYL